MTLQLSFSLDDLVQLYAGATEAPSPYASPELAGLAAVLDHIAHAARKACAHDFQRYDHRSLYEFTAELDYACRRAAALSGHTESPSDRCDGHEHVGCSAHS